MARTGHRQMDLARVLNISKPHMCLCLAGVRNWTSDQAMTLATITGIPIEKLLRDKMALRLAQDSGKQYGVDGENAK